MSTSLLFTLIGVGWIISIIILAIYFSYAKKQRIKKQKETYNRLKPLINDPNIVKVALWINIDFVNDVEYTDDCEYSTNLKNGLLNPHPVSVALFEPGEYSFIVSSNSREKYQGIEMHVTLLPGQVYQLGCNSNGPYLVPDPDPSRYEYKA